MTINFNYGNQSSIYSASTSSNTRLQNISSGDFSASLITSSSTEDLSQEEKLYDLDGDGVLSVTEKAAYDQAQAAKKETETPAVQESGETNRQNMSDESSIIRQATLNRLKESNEFNSEGRSEIETSNQKDIDTLSFAAQRAIDLYKSHQFTQSESLFEFDAAV